MASTFISLPSLAANGPIDVVVNASTDSIRISDGTDTLAVNPDGSINVVSSPTGNNSYLFDEVTGVAINASATVITQFFASSVKLRKVNISGTNRATFALKFDSTEIDKCRTSLQDFNVQLDYETGILVPANTTVSVEVTNAGPSLGNFNALLLYSAV
jgi:hypothetical protein